MEPLIDPVHGHGRYENTCPHLLSTSVILLQQLKHYCVHRMYHIFSRFTVSPVLSVFCSQSLVNLLVTGHAVSNVWDGDRECSGMSKTSMKLLLCTQTHHIHTRGTHITLAELNFVATDLNHIHHTVIILTSHSAAQKAQMNASLT